MSPFFFSSSEDSLSDDESSDEDLAPSFFSSPDDSLSEEESSEEEEEEVSSEEDFLALSESSEDEESSSEDDELTAEEPSLLLLSESYRKKMKSYQILVRVIQGHHPHEYVRESLEISSHIVQKKYSGTVAWTPPRDLGPPMHVHALMLFGAILYAIRNKHIPLSSMMILSSSSSSLPSSSAFVSPPLRRLLSFCPWCCLDSSEYEALGNDLRIVRR